MSQDQMEDIADKAAKRAIEELFLRVGIDVKDPKGVIELQKDFAYTRETREGKEEFVKKGKHVLIASFITGALAVLVNGLLNWRQ